MNNKYLLVLVTLRQKLLALEFLSDVATLRGPNTAEKKQIITQKSGKSELPSCPTCYQFSMSYRKKFLDMNVVYISFTKTACSKKK